MKYRAFLTVLILSAVVFFGCRDSIKVSKADESATGTYHPARYIKYVPERVLPDQAIEIVFVNPVSDISKAGTAIKENIFEFKPDISGESKWKDDRTLVFIPEKELKQRQNYVVNLKLSLLGGKYAEASDYKFDFDVAGRDITFYKGDMVELKNGKARYEANLSFSYKTDNDMLKKELSLTMNGNTIGYEITGGDKDFKIITDDIPQSDEKKLFRIFLPKTKLNLSEDYELEFSFTKLNEMAVRQISRKEENEKPVINILFASELADDQDIKGLIAITPDVKADIKKTGKTIIVSGDFEFGKEYDLYINSGLRNKYGSRLKSDHKTKIQFTDKPPKVNFTDNGCFMASGNKKKVRFMTQNLKQVELVVKKVYESNLGQFLQGSSLRSRSDDDYYGYDYDYYNFDRVGIEIKRQKLEIGDKVVNDWVTNEIDLSRIIPDKDKGLYVLELTFKDSNTLYRSEVTHNRWDRRYPRLFGKVTKNIINSNIGITYVQADEKNIVHVFDLETAKPMEKAEVRLLDYQNQVMQRAFTDKEGRAVLGKTERNVFLVEADNNGQRSVIKTGEMKVNLSSFDTGGAEYKADKTRGFIYTERGVYRPGDEINISMIFRNKDNTFPKDHPVKIEIKNPQNKVVKTETLKSGEDGFYNYRFKTDQDDMTGNWYFTADAGGEKFGRTLKIETIVPERLDVDIVPEKEKLSYNDRSIRLELKSKYLFGNPASGLSASLKYNITGYSKKFNKYKDYSFVNETAQSPSLTDEIFSGTLNGEGKADIKLNIPDLRNVPSAVTVTLSAEVLDNGARPNKASLKLDHDPYRAYAGVTKPSGNYVRTNSEIELSAVLLNTEGVPFPGSDMTVRIYYNSRYWWWDYSGRNDRMKYRSDFDTEIILEEKFTSSDKPHKFVFNPARDGLYLVEVTQSAENSHSAAYFVNASYWGGNDNDISDAELLTLRTEKDIYAPGETAVVRFPTGLNSRVIVSVDKGSSNIDSYSLESSGTETAIQIPVTKAMVPNIYCTVSVIQPNSQADNDRPVRLVGTIPIGVEEKLTKQEIGISVPGSLRPNEKFSIGIDAGAETQFTIAVVDEGLLSLTDFSTPDVWKFFYSKLRLGVNLYDLYNLVINANKGDVMNVFSAGGGLAERSKMLSNVKADRFKAVAMFKGPLKTDKNGKAEVEFMMPEYIGAVRIMVVSAKNENFGSADKRVPVKSELMVQPTLPRTLSPGDEFDLPVTVFCMDGKVKEAQVELELQGPLTSEEKIITVRFDKVENKLVYFRVKVGSAIGVGHVKIKALSGKFRAESNTEIAVKAPSPREFSNKTMIVEKGATAEFMIPQKYLDGTVNASVSVSRIKMPDVNKRLNNILGYPYGCLEQTTSKGFPQLAVKPLLKQYSALYEELDGNINTTIAKLWTFQNDNGSFSYWPGRNTYYSSWADIYAGHFLLESGKKGYFVPTDMWDNWKRNMHSVAIMQKVQKISDWISWKDSREKREKYNEIRIQIYRLFVLALAGEPETGAMNLMKEINLNYLDDTERWMMAVCYKAAGMKETAENIALTAGVLVDDYTELSGTFGCVTRDKAMILISLVEMDMESKAVELYGNLVDEINSDEWFSTQTSGFVMLAIGKFMDKYPQYFRTDVKYGGTITIDDNETVELITKELSGVKQITAGPGTKVRFTSIDGAGSDNIFVTLNWDGISSQHPTVREGKGLLIERYWLDESGQPMENDPKTVIGKIFKNSDSGIRSVKQGDIFRLKIKVTKTSASELKNMALVQILPSGWEIENKRLNDDNAYSTASTKRSYGYSSGSYNYSQHIRYTDIRDDRVMWFYDMDKNVKEMVFEIDLRAVTTGKFYMPETLTESMYSREYYFIDPGMSVEVVK